MDCASACDVAGGPITVGRHLLPSACMQLRACSQHAALAHAGDHLHQQPDPGQDLHRPRRHHEGRAWLGRAPCLPVCRATPQELPMQGAPTMPAQPRRALPTRCCRPPPHPTHPIRSAPPRCGASTLAWRPSCGSRRRGSFLTRTLDRCGHNGRGGATRVPHARLPFGRKASKRRREQLAVVMVCAELPAPQLHPAARAGRPPGMPLPLQVRGFLEQGPNRFERPLIHGHWDSELLAGGADLPVCAAVPCAAARPTRRLQPGRQQ